MALTDFSDQSLGSPSKRLRSHPGAGQVRSITAEDEEPEDDFLVDSHVGDEHPGDMDICVQCAVDLVDGVSDCVVESGRRACRNCSVNKKVACRSVCGCGCPLVALSANLSTDPAQPP